MNVKFIDTSVMVNLLEIPGMCDQAESVKQQWRIALEEKDTLILPIATIIETGNHIAHISDGNIRRKIAGKFGEYLRKTAEGEAPWKLYGKELDEAGLLYLADHIEENAVQRIGTGDLSIVYAYEQYKELTPAIGKIMIWSIDTHLQGYRAENVSMTRRRKR